MFLSIKNVLLYTAVTHIQESCEDLSNSIKIKLNRLFIVHMIGI